MISMLSGPPRADLNEYLLALAVMRHLVELEVAQQAATERLLEAVAKEGDRPRESRMSSLSKREHLNVADLTGRRHGRTYGPSRDGWIPVKWLDTGERQMVRESGLLMRFTTQSAGFVPKSERDAQAAREAEVGRRGMFDRRVNKVMVREIEIIGRPTPSSPVNYRILRNDAHPHRVGKTASIRQSELRRKYR